MDNNELSTTKLPRLLEALTKSGVTYGLRNKTVAAATRYSEGSIKRLLSGNTPITDRFVREVCSKFQIREEWVKNGEEPQLVRELPVYRLKLALQEIGATEADLIAEMHPSWSGYSWADMPDLLSGRQEMNKDFINQISIVFGVNKSWIFYGEHPMFDEGCKIQYRELDKNADAKSQIRLKSTPLGDIFPSQISEKELCFIISNHFGKYDEECTDDLNLGAIISDILFHLPHLARHEVLELMHQIWKLRYNRSDSLAVQAADEDFARYGVKPTTRIKLERIPVELDEEKTQK